MADHRQDLGLQDQPEKTSIFRISKNFLFILIARIIDVLGQFATMFLVPRYLGAGSYGDYGFVLAFALMPISFTYLGIDRIMTREVARNKEAASAYWGAAILSRWLYMAMLFPLVLLVVYLMNLSQQVIFGIWLAILAFNFMGDALINLALFRAFEKMYLETLLTLTYQSLNLISVLVVIHFDFGFIGLFWGITVVQLIRCLVAYAISMQAFVKPVFRAKRHLIKFFLKETYVYGLYILLNQLLINLELFALKRFQDSYAVSMFYAPHTLMLATTIFPNAFLSAIYPLIARAAVNEGPALPLICTKCLRLMVFFAFLVFVPFYGLADKIIPLVFGQEFFQAIAVFQILCFSMVLIMISFVFDYPLSAVNKQNSLIYCSLGALGAKITLSFLLIPAYGAVGASMSTIGGYLSFLIIGLILTSRYIAKLPLLRILVKPALVSFLLILLLSRIAAGNIFLFIPLSIVIYCGALLKLGFFADDEILFLKSLLRKIAPSQSTG